jgi:hypothetical protein
MKKLYVITDNLDRPQSMGASNRTSWTNVRWVNYHLNRRFRYPQNYKVHVINLKEGTVEQSSAPAFLSSLPQNSDKMKAEIKAHFGFAVDLSTLESLHRTNALNPLIREDVFTFLTSKGITL